jgi:Amidohydrolase
VGEWTLWLSPIFPQACLAALQASRSARLLGAPASLVLHRRARGPRSQHLTIASWDKPTLCDSARSDHGCLTFPDRCSGMPLKKRPSEYLRDLYFDSIVFTSEALRHLVVECGAGQIVMGTDYPYPWTSTAVEHILGTPSLSDAERAAILGDTACKLLRIAP